MNDINDPRIEAFRAAYNDSTQLMFSDNEGGVNARWFLRSGLNEECEKNLVFIGIVPGEARELIDEGGYSDESVRIICRGVGGRVVDGIWVPNDFRRLTIINLLPFSKDFIGDKSESDPDYRKGLRYTKEIVKTVLADADRIILFWGSPTSSDFKWKKDAIKRMQQYMRELPSVEDCVIEAQLSLNHFHPYHVNGRGGYKWDFHNLQDARFFLNLEVPK